MPKSFLWPSSRRTKRTFSLLKDHRKEGWRGRGSEGREGGMEGRQTVWLSLCICNERGVWWETLQAVTRPMLYASVCLSDRNEWVKNIHDLYFFLSSSLSWVNSGVFSASVEPNLSSLNPGVSLCGSLCVCVAAPADVDSHLLSWRANWLLMFLSKHRWTPGGRGDQCSLNLQHSGMQQRQQRSLHVHPYLSACPLQIILSLIAPSLFDPLQHTHIYTSSPSPSLSPDPRPFQYFPLISLLYTGV